MQYRKKNCVHCGAEYRPAAPNNLTCSLKCTLMERCIPEPNTGCWLWTAALTQGGYGSVYDLAQSRWRTAHRAAYETFVSAIPDGMDILHSCDVPCCINPDHLRPGTHAENMADSSRKGRMKASRARGEGQHLAKLTAADVLAIRAAQGTYRDIARQFGVTHATVGYIRRGVTWKHV